MPATNEFQELTERTQALLAKQEGLEVDFKIDLKGVDAGDLVAFANSPSGGAILVGVREIELPSGLQRGEIVGCPVDDRTRLTLLNKAQDCTPPIEIELFVENLGAERPILRIEVPSHRNPHKPYCTKRGEYRIRGDGRNKALLPQALLTTYLEVEGEEFLGRFRSAAQAIETSVTTMHQELQGLFEEVRSSLHRSLGEIETEVATMRQRIDMQLGDVFDTASATADLADTAMGLSDEAAAKVTEVDGKVEELAEDLSTLHSRVEALLRHFDIEDPLVAKHKRMLRLVATSTLREAIRCRRSNKKWTKEELVKQLPEDLHQAFTDQELAALAEQVLGESASGNQRH